MVPVFIWNHSEDRCDVVPVPCVAALILPGWARAYSMNSANEFTGIFRGLIIRPIGITVRIDTGTNSVGSKLIFA